MRKLTSSLFITLDGVIENPHAWNPPYFNDEMTAAFKARLAATDTHMYGRRSYEMFRSVFTGAKSEAIAHAPVMNETPKVLVSASAANADWGPTTVIHGDIHTEILALKRRPGRDIDVQASGTLVRFLLEQQLLDELHLLVHPTVIGHGKRLFQDGAAPVALELISAVTFRTGVVHLRLTPQHADPVTPVAS